MAKGGSFDFGEFKKLQKQLEKMEKDMDAFCEECSRYLAARLLSKAIKRTPVKERYPRAGDTVEFTAHLPGGQVTFDTKSGKHVSFKAKPRVKKVKFQLKKSSGLTGGTLRRGWTAQASGSGAEGLKTRGAAEYVDTLKVHHFGDTYVIEIINPVEYASYVEFGHRTANHKGWVKGQFMLTISERELQAQAPKMIEKKLEAKLREVFDV